MTSQTKYTLGADVPAGEELRDSKGGKYLGVTITVTDSGLGVPPTELEQLNRDLAHGAEAPAPRPDPHPTTVRRGAGSAAAGSGRARPHAAP